MKNVFLEPEMETGSLFFFFLDIPVFESFKNNPALYLILPFTRSIDFVDMVKSVLTFEPVIYIYPCTGDILVNLTVTVLHAATGTIQQTLGAGGHRTDTGSFIEDAVTTEGTHLLVLTEATDVAKKHGIQTTHNVFINVG